MREILLGTLSWHPWRSGGISVKVKRGVPTREVAAANLFKF
jgi:hypothetical protein